MNAGGSGGQAHGFLERAWVGMMSHGFFADGVGGEVGGGEEVLPVQLAGGVGVFFCQGVGQVYFAVAVFEVLLVGAGDVLELLAQGGDECFGQHGGPVVFAFAIAHDDLSESEVDVFDAQAQALHEAQPAAVEDLGHELGCAAHVFDDGACFGGGEDGGQGARFFGADDVGWEFDGLVEDVTVEEEDGAEGLVLCGGGDVLLGGEVGEEILNFCDAHLCGVAFVVVEDESFDPVFVGLFGAVGVVFEAQGVGDLV